MAGFGETLSALVRDGDDYVIDVPDAWAQGRTLFGGMTAALAYAAVGRALGDLGPLRSAQFTFVGPATGWLRIAPSLLRRGRSSAVVAADSRNGEGPAARATFLFGAARASAVAHDFAPRMDVPPPDDCIPFHATTRPLPGFLARFEYRRASGARLFARDARPEFAVWTRLRDGDGSDQVAALLALADALPCAAMASFPKPAAVSTMAWMVDFHQPLVASAGWHLVWSRSTCAADGYSQQDMAVYNRSGTPLVSARQLVAIFA